MGAAQPAPKWVVVLLAAGSAEAVGDGSSGFRKLFYPWLGICLR